MAIFEVRQRFLPNFYDECTQSIHSVGQPSRVQEIPRVTQNLQLVYVVAVRKRCLKDLIKSCERGHVINQPIWRHLFKLLVTGQLELSSPFASPCLHLFW